MDRDFISVGHDVYIEHTGACRTDSKADMSSLQLQLCDSCVTVV